VAAALTNGPVTPKMTAAERRARENILLNVKRNSLKMTQSKQILQNVIE
jgi:hypothetical protein